jgi:hypothetical protein
MDRLGPGLSSVACTFLRSILDALRVPSPHRPSMPQPPRLGPFSVTRHGLPIAKSARRPRRRRNPTRLRLVYIPPGKSRHHVHPHLKYVLHATGSERERVVSEQERIALRRSTCLWA